MSRVRVKHKGQVTIPAELRARLGISEGDILEAGERDGKIVFTPSPPLEGGKAIGREEHKKVIGELDRLRRGWR